jgi:hypothetical protein
MRDAHQDAGMAALHEELFRLNLNYLLFAQRLMAQDAHQAAILLGIKEPLTSWLPGASVSAITALARSPVVVHTLRLQKKAAASVLAAYDEGRWIGPAHVATSAIEAKP